MFYNLLFNLQWYGLEMLIGQETNIKPQCLSGTSLEGVNQVHRFVIPSWSDQTSSVLVHLHLGLSVVLLKNYSGGQYCCTVSHKLLHVNPEYSLQRKIVTLLYSYQTASTKRDGSAERLQ